MTTRSTRVSNNITHLVMGRILILAGVIQTVVSVLFIALAIDNWHHRPEMFYDPEYVLVLSIIVIGWVGSVYLAYEIGKGDPLVLRTGQWVSYRWIMFLLSLSPELKDAMENNTKQRDVAQAEIKRLVRKIARYEAKNKDVSALLHGLPLRNIPGFIYVMRREDGIIKIGRAVDPDQRLSEHVKDYGLQFELVHRFVVPDAIQFEKLALRMTKKFEYKENNRLELRLITDDDLDDFLTTFTACCLGAICAH